MTKIQLLRRGLLALAIVLAVNAAISAWYYLRIIGVMYFRPSEVAPEGRGGMGAGFATLLCTLAVLIIGGYPGPLVEYAKQASRSVRKLQAPVQAAAYTVPAPALPAASAEPSAELAVAADSPR